MKTYLLLTMMIFSSFTIAETGSVEVGEHNPATTTHKCSDGSTIACVGCKKVCGNIQDSDKAVDKKNVKKLNVKPGSSASEI